ncbi:MAG TPA: hypothetical protein VGM53_23170 [Streptosporangiaceae bacterium]|jgi:hypothetical protein
MIGEHAGPDDDEAEVRVGIETDRGLWVRALAKEIRKGLEQTSVH